MPARFGRISMTPRRCAGAAGLVIAAGLFAAFWLVSGISRLLNPLGEFAYLGLAAFLAVWSLAQIPARGRDEPGQPGSIRRRSTLSVSWIGIFLLLVGVECLLAAALRRVEPGTRLLFGGLGLLFSIWGVREILSRLLPSLRPYDRPQNRITLPRPGLVYLVIMSVMFVGSLLGRSNMLMLVFALMAGPFVLNGWITFNMLKRTRVERRVPPHAMAGEVVTAEIILHNRKHWIAGWLMAVRDRITGPHEQLEADVLFARVPPRSSRSAVYHLRMMQRGIYDLGPILVSTRFPLGLVERSLMFEAPGQLIVLPRVGKLTPEWKRRCGVSDELVHRRDTKRGTFEDDFHRMREYRWGDNPRAIHWRTSARQNQLMVREYHQSRDWNLLILLDLWLPRRPSEEDHDRVELATSFAATICVDQLRLGRDANLYAAVAGATLVEWEGPSRPASIESLLAALAVQHAGLQPDLQTALGRVLSRRAHSSRMVLITTRRRGNGSTEATDELSRTLSGFDAAGELVVVHADESDLSQFFVLA